MVHTHTHKSQLTLHSDKMALALRLSYKDADDVIRAFALHDLLMSKMEDAPMHPGDDYYLAPYGMVTVPARKRKGEDRIEHTYLLFTGYKVREAHDTAWMACGSHRGEMRLLGSLGDIVDGALGLKVPESKIQAFRRSAWAGGDDVSLAMEEHVFTSACQALGVETPTDWQVQRRAVFANLGGDPDKLSTVPAEGTWPFLPEDHAGAVAEEARCTAARLKADPDFAPTPEALAQKTQTADEARMKRYLPTIDKFKDAAVPAEDAELCVFVFETTPDGADGPFHCPYDRKEGSPFCSMCMKMVDMYKADKEGI